MQILDEKARLFGKINIIDLALIIIGVLLIIFVLVFSQFYIYPKPIIYYIAPPSAATDSQTKLQIVGNNFTKSSFVYIGDRNLSGINFINDRVIELNIPKDMQPGKYDIKVANRKRFGVLSNALTLNPPSPPPAQPAILEKQLKIKVKLSNLLPEVVERIKEGSSAKDTSSRVIAKITKIVSKEPTKLIHFIDGFKSFDHPTNIDIVAMFEILARIENFDYLYQKQIVRINKYLKFAMDLFEVEAKIISIEE